jgi:PAS domain S-box-containing protein
MASSFESSGMDTSVSGAKGASAAPEVVPAGAILRVDAGGRVLDYGAAIGGAELRPEGLLGRRLDEVVPAAIAAALMRSLTAAIENRTVQMGEYVVSGPDRDRRLLVRFVPTGQGECLITIADLGETTAPEGPRPAVSGPTDLTALEQRDEALEERELRAIIDNVPGVVYRRVRHPDGRITFPYHSSQAGPRYGFDAAGLASDSTPLQEAIHPEDRAPWLAAIEQSASGLTPFQIDYRFRSRSGDWRWVRSLATPTERDDGSVSWDGISFDVTELKATEQALRESEERYRRLVEAAPDAIVIHQDGRIRFANFRAAELAGVAAWNAARSPTLGRRASSVPTASRFRSR